MHSYLKILLVFLIIAFCLTALLPGCSGKNTTSPSNDDPVSYDASVLFIGSSLTYYNNLPEMLADLADSNGIKLYVEQATASGATLQDHCTRQETFEKIRSRNWDYVILQDATLSIALFEYHNQTIPFTQILKDSILNNNQETEIIFFMWYGQKDGVDYLGEQYSYATFQEMLKDGTLIVADSLQLIVAPVGWAYNSSINERPNLDLYIGDKIHPSPAGSYIGACVYYSTIFRESCEGFQYFSSLTEDDASFLQAKASETVMNNLTLWNIPE
jgi:hypothetical protein